MLLTKAQVVRGSEEEEMIFQIEHMLSFVGLSYVIWTEFRDLIQNEKETGVLIDVHYLSSSFLSYSHTPELARLTTELGQQQSITVSSDSSTICFRSRSLHNTKM